MKISAPLLALLLISSICRADEKDELSTVLDGLSQLNYDSAGQFTLGDTLSLETLSSPKSRCISYNSETGVKPDTEGAVDSFLRVRLIKTYDDAENELKFSFSYHAAAKAKIGSIASGGSSLTDTGKYESFFKNQTDTMMLVIEAYANHGRDMIENWSYAAPYQALLDSKDYSTFQAKCGSYFIRGKRLVSRLRVTFNFSGLQSQSKNLIANTFKGTSEVGASISGVSGQAETDISLDLANTLTMAHRLGKVTSDVETTGGEGIKTVANILSGLDVTDQAAVSGLIKGIINASSDLVRKNAAPELFILVPHPDLAGQTEPFDSQDYIALGSIFKALMRVDQQRAIYDSYKEQDAALYNKYFAMHSVKLDDLRKELVQRYSDCRAGKRCRDAIPTSVQGVYLSDVLYDGSLTVDCPRSYVTTEHSNPITSEQLDYISSINLYWTGKIRYSDDIDLASMAVYRVGPDLKQEQYNLKVSEYMRLWGQDKSFRNMMTWVYTRPIDSTKAINPDGSLNFDYIVGQRNDIAKSIFSLKFNLLNGTSLEEVLGMPIMKNCRPGG